MLSLSLPKGGECSLVDLIDDFYAEDEMEYRCNSCREGIKSKKKLDCWKLPKVMVFHHNRFEFDGSSAKKVNRVDFPLSGLILGTCSSTEKCSVSYDLCGVAN